MCSFTLRLEPTVRVQRERAEAEGAFFEASKACKKKVRNAVTRERARQPGEFFIAKQKQGLSLLLFCLNTSMFENQQA